MAPADPLDEARRLADELGLFALGYEVKIEYDLQGHVAIQLRHPLRGNGVYGWHTLSGLDPDWPAKLAAKISRWPDIEVVRKAGKVRPESVPILRALRHAEVMQLLRHRRFRAGANAAVAAIENVAFGLQEMAGILNEDEVDWLLMAFESDQEELREPRRPARRPREGIQAQPE